MHKPLEVIKDGDRFRLCLGVYGTYFYDKQMKRPLTNDLILDFLESWAVVRKQNQVENNGKEIDVPRKSKDETVPLPSVQE